MRGQRAPGSGWQRAPGKGQRAPGRGAKALREVGAEDLPEVGGQRTLGRGGAEGPWEEGRGGGAVGPR